MITASPNDEEPDELALAAPARSSTVRRSPGDPLPLGARGRGSTTASGPTIAATDRAVDRVGQDDAERVGDRDRRAEGAVQGEEQHASNTAMLSTKTAIDRGERVGPDARSRPRTAARPTESSSVNAVDPERPRGQDIDDQAPDEGPDEPGLETAGDGRRRRRRRARGPVVRRRSGRYGTMVSSKERRHRRRRRRRESGASACRTSASVPTVARPPTRHSTRSSSRRRRAASIPRTARKRATARSTRPTRAPQDGSGSPTAVFHVEHRRSERASARAIVPVTDAGCDRRNAARLRATGHADAWRAETSATETEVRRPSDGRINDS